RQPTQSIPRFGIISPSATSIGMRHNEHCTDSPARGTAWTISAGFCLPASAAALTSAEMMSLHTAMHSSQIKTEGPALNLATSFSRLLQNEQRRTSIFRNQFYAALMGARAGIKPAPTMRILTIIHPGILMIIHPPLG